MNYPILIYDGECSICREWVNYWQELTNGKISFCPFQDLKKDSITIEEAEFASAIHLIEQDGTVSKGAEATYRLYRDIHPYSLLLYLYRFLPGFALISESGYRFLSTHRKLLAFFTHLFWGKKFSPSRYELISGLFLRLSGIIYLIAFVSFTVQASALIGADGVLPLEYFLNAVREQYASNYLLTLPGLFWISHTDGFIHFVCYAGILFSVFLIIGLMQRLAPVVLYILYLSLVNSGQVFMSFQWDLLLLECGFLAIFLPWGSKIIVWIYRWLVFRFMFLGGVVKIISRDPGWDSLTALNYHFETQPLPSPLSWYLHHFPEVLLKSATAMTLIIELILPFFIFAPRRIRHFAGIIFIGFQLIILLTGNYNFFNLLTIFICLFLFDDRAIRWICPNRLVSYLIRHERVNVGFIASSFATLMLIISLYIGWSQINFLFDRNTELSALHKIIRPFGIINSYGPFAVMTTVRYEIVLEGSRDHGSWKEYQFKYKPGDLKQCPGWVQPHQPRVDWQMWFAALGKPEQQRWLFNLIIRLLQGSEPIKQIFSYNPFPGDPPARIRAKYYRYTYTSLAERKATGRCWNREYVAEYFPSISLD